MQPMAGWVVVTVGPVSRGSLNLAYVSAPQSQADFFNRASYLCKAAAKVYGGSMA